MKRLLVLVFLANLIFTYSQDTLKVTKFCMHCKGIKTTLTIEGTPYACKYCNGTGIIKEENIQNKEN